MDPKRYETFHAPGHSFASALHLPGVSQRAPRIDERLVEPETRQEIVRGERMLAMPANPPHADRQSRLDFVLGGAVAPGFIVATELLTRTSESSDFATDVCVRREGTDEFGTRHLEELAFEVVSEQTLRNMTIRAEELSRCGVRRIIAVFVKRGEVGEWSPDEGRFIPLPLGAMLEDRTLLQPLPIRALLDAAAANETVARALRAKNTPYLVEREREISVESNRAGVREGRREGRREGVLEGLARTILLLLNKRGLKPSDDQRARIVGCRDEARFERWVVATTEIDSVAELLAIE
jgi:hypothetical protein